MSDAHVCPKCDVFVTDLLESALPHDYADKDKIKDPVRKALASTVGYAIKKLISDYAIDKMKEIWSTSVFEAKSNTSTFHYSSIAHALVETLSSNYYKWDNEIDYLCTLAIDAGLVKHKGVTYARLVRITNDWISYCVYLIWTTVPSCHFNHLNKHGISVPDLFIFHNRLSLAYECDDLYS
jgi:hypothetical protein